MAYKSGPNSPLGFPGIGAAGDDTAKVPVGTICTMYDDVLGPADFIYLPGVNGTVADDAVVYDLVPGGQATTRLASATAPNSGRPVAIAKSACVATQFGWYQISGVSIVNVIAATVAGVAMTSGTAGSLGSAAVPGCQLLGARISSPIGTPAAGKAYVTLNRPSLQSQLT